MVRRQSWGQDAFNIPEKSKIVNYDNDIHKIISVLFCHSEKGVNNFQRDIVLYSKTVNNIIINNTTDVSRKIFYLMEYFIRDTCKKSIENIKKNDIPYHRKICFSLLEYLDEFPELENTISSIMIDLYRIFIREQIEDKYVNLLCIEFSWMFVPPSLTDDTMVDKFFTVLDSFINKQDFSLENKIEMNLDIISGVLCEKSLDKKFDSLFEEFLLKNSTSSDLLRICRYFAQKRVTDIHKYFIGCHCLIPFFFNLGDLSRWHFKLTSSIFSYFNLKDDSVIYDNILEYLDQIKREILFIDIKNIMDILFFIFPKRYHDEIRRIFFKNNNFSADIVPVSQN